MTYNVEVSLFQRKDDEDKVELVDLEDFSEPLQELEKEQGVPTNADEFLGLKPEKKDPLAPLQEIGGKTAKKLKGGVLRFLSRILPGLEDVVDSGSRPSEAEVKEKIEKEAEDIREQTVTETTGAEFEPGGDFELEALLQPLVKQEVEDLLNQEYEQEVLFVQWEREKYRNHFLGWVVTALSAVLLLALATAHAGAFINHLTDPHLSLPQFLEKPFGSNIAQGTVFVTAMTDVLLAFLIFVLAATSLISGVLSKSWRGIIMACEGFMGLFLWLGFMDQSKYFSALITLIVVFVIFRITERVGR